MKKFIIILLSILILTGCKSNNDEDIPDENEIKVCKETCETDQDLFQSHLLNYQSMIDAHMIAIIENKYGDGVYLDQNTWYSKEDIPRFDPITDHHIIKIETPYTSFNTLLRTLNAYIPYCSIEGVCEGASYGQTFFSTGIDYGFDDESGYFHQVLVKGTDDERIENYTYNVTDDDFGYESLAYFPNKGKVFYKHFKNNIYQAYEYFSDSEYSYTYVDINTNEYIFYSLSDGNEWIQIYNPNTEMSFEKYRTQYTVSLYDNFDLVTSLLKAEEIYTVTISLFSLSDWNLLKIIDSSGSAQVSTYSSFLDGYAISARSKGSRYYNVNAKMNLDESQLALYNFPSTYTGKISFIVLNQELIIFMGSENLLDSTGLSKDSIKSDCLDLLDQYAGIYKEG
ncbi:MAG: hypothetical protein ABII85_02230 [Bacillota bacterium]